MTQVVVGAASRCAPREQVCGDAYVVTAAGGDATLICLADGLGHGPNARAAAVEACTFAREHAAESLETLLRGMDRALGATRGAAVSVLRVETQSRRARFAGVGNVELRSISRASIAPPTRPGIVGGRLTAVRVWDYAIEPGDLFVLTSDGVSSRYDIHAFAALEPQAMAEAIVEGHYSGHDDACCVVARLVAAPRLDARDPEAPQ